MCCRMAAPAPVSASKVVALIRYQGRIATEATNKALLVGHGYKQSHCR